MSLFGEETQEKYSEAEESSPVSWFQFLSPAVGLGGGTSFCDFEIPEEERRGTEAWWIGQVWASFIHAASISGVSDTCQAGLEWLPEGILQDLILAHSGL